MSPFLWYFLLWFIPLNLYAIGIWLICAITGERVHFIEFSDQNWCPQLWRQCVRNSLHYGWTSFSFQDYIGSPAKTLSNVIIPYVDKLKCNLIIDLCSGSGGPTPAIHKMINKTKSVKTVLTDLFPQISVWKYQCSRSPNLLFSSKSVNAALVKYENIFEISNMDRDENKINLRTLFGSFHHFKPDLATQILADAMVCNDAFIMCEALLYRGTIFHFLQWPLQLLLLSPSFILYMIIGYLFLYKDNALSMNERFFKCMMIVITAPIWVALFIHDGIISNARVYTHSELMSATEVAKEIAKEKVKSEEDKDRIANYEWKCWRQESDMIFPLGYAAPITVLVGTPKI